MRSLRAHGRSPYRLAVIHGGPGAPGSVEPIARALASEFGVLEPIQTATSVDGQVEELRTTLEASAILPVTLIGWSWGAWLSLMTAARYPSMVSKLILVGSGPFESRYAEEIIPTRLGRLSPEEREEATSLLARIEGSAARSSGRQLARFGELMARADAFEPIEIVESPAGSTHAEGESGGGGELLGTTATSRGSRDEDLLLTASASRREEFADAVEATRASPDSSVYQSVWREAAEMRASGKLIEMLRTVRCPVLAIHGDHDPHPAEGVREPLSRTLTDFRFVLLERCGHEPWNERHARERFFAVLRAELKRGR